MKVYQHLSTVRCNAGKESCGADGNQLKLIQPSKLPSSKYTHAR